jgi:hypothetical protein
MSESILTIGHDYKKWRNKDGLLHRIDGPKEYYLYDKILTEEEFNTITDLIQRKLIWGGK